MLKAYIKLMRVHHYLKNLLVFAALACGGEFFAWDKLSAAFIGFVAFCMTSSVVYIINDIQDREKDRCHPKKCNRPIASGAVPVRKAIILAVVLLIIAVVCNFSVFHVVSTVALLIYFIVNLAYSMGLKNIPIVDIGILAAGFLIRVIYGAVITGIVISNWLYLTVIAGALYFALGKRRNELKKISGGETRKVLKAYPAAFLDRTMVMCLTLTNVFYALWSMDEKTVSFYNNRYLIWTVPFIWLITMKYSMTIEGDSDGDPVEVLLHDKMLLSLCVGYLAIMFIILYW